MPPNAMFRGAPLAARPLQLELDAILRPFLECFDPRKSTPIKFAHASLLLAKADESALDLAARSATCAFP